MNITSFIPMDGEQSSQFNAGLDLAMDLSKFMRAANLASFDQTYRGMKQWWLILCAVDRMIAPRLRKAEHQKMLSANRVPDFQPPKSRQQEQALVGILMKRLTMYQVTLEHLRDKLGLGFKAGDDAGMAILGKMN